MEVHACQTESGRNQGRRRSQCSAGFGALAVQKKLSVELARSPAAQDGSHRRIINPQEGNHGTQIGGEVHDRPHIEITVGPSVKTVTNAWG